MWQSNGHLDNADLDAAYYAPRRVVVTQQLLRKGPLEVQSLPVGLGLSLFRFGR